LREAIRVGLSVLPFLKRRLALHIPGTLVDLVPSRRQCSEDSISIICFLNPLQKLNVLFPIASNRILIFRGIVHVLEGMKQASLLSSRNRLLKHSFNTSDDSCVIRFARPFPSKGTDYEV